jgi:geranylgeranyl pyrophosphate synthase
MANVLDDLDVPWLTDGLARTEARLREAVTAEDPYLTEIAGHLIGAGGKRLRPVLTMMAAAAGGAEVTDDVITGGVSVELVHIGSLYHDDVMDDA